VTSLPDLTDLTLILSATFLHVSSSPVKTLALPSLSTVVARSTASLCVHLSIALVVVAMTCRACGSIIVCMYVSQREFG